MEQEQCGQCSHKNNCQNIYQRFSNAKGHSVLLRTVLALLLPLIIFIVTAAVCEKLLTNLTDNRLLAVLLSILSGIIAAFIYVAIVRMWRFENRG